ncbi:hypothetical protein, partial [Vibrio cholerae]|uniref:hypothetical protein n=1 Tax=Vibrio cholerae TaxID=666 RepID=UPI001F433D1A
HEGRKTQEDLLFYYLKSITCTDRTNFKMSNNKDNNFVPLSQISHFKNAANRLEWVLPWQNLTKGCTPYVRQ